jgi:hypothetical protein
MPTCRALGVAVAGFLGLVLAASVGGCATINVPDYSGVAKEAVHDYSGSGSERDWAVQRAREAAIEKGLKSEKLTDDYSISPAQGEKCWWVDFRYKKSEQQNWPERFVVRVDMDGKTRIYDRAGAPAH